ncbi:hypothetical protein ACMU_13935 [Actibacterium mucosum KCTC 23349]|uniref:Uncharacterized protein n=2 Tax=Actibacterium TaxID=1433986 RepID=A0A037ZEF4_9RHOB|nr:hypothetical protein ACMU_13935 [Actibacterium mucosum KCTC 23349]
MDMPFSYYADRESPWLLGQLMDRNANVAELRKSAAGKLLSRPLVKPLVAGCGGALSQRDVLALAHADKAIDWPDLSKPALQGLEQVFATVWQDFVLSFAEWGKGRRWYDQTTRNRQNLVVQLGFASDHAALMGRYFGKLQRKDLEFDGHPIRLTGRPTLAWARLDICRETGHALIEEVQSDWLRFARDEVEALQSGRPQVRQLAMAEQYEAGLVRLYGKIWPRVMMLAVLTLLCDQLGVQTVWMHQPEAGVALKNIHGTPPPRSLYTDLPRRFCFAATRDRPPFLRSLPKQRTKRLPKSGPLFWRLELVG